MNDDATLNKALVVLSPDLVRPDKPEDSILMQRAVALARATGCELELFHVCYDSGLEDGLLRSGQELRREKRQFIDEQATRVAELAANLARQSVRVSHETRWDHPRIDAILRKVGKSSPDVVMKQAREHSYILGIASNADWELARRSSAHVWLVNDDTADIDRIVAAIGCQSPQGEDNEAISDSALLQSADFLANAYGAAVYAVNAFQLPISPGVVAGPTGTATAIPLLDNKELRESTVKRHSDYMRALVQRFDIPINHVRIREGPPDSVVPDVAEEVAADLIVLGARNIGRLERLVTQVTVEPVMSRTRGDIFVVRDSAPPALPEAVTRPLRGRPTFSLDRALVDPEDSFESPQEVASLSEVSLDLRQRILQAWEYDIRAEMAKENEGGPTGDIAINDLEDILAAKEVLEMKKKRQSGQGRTLGDETT